MASTGPAAAPAFTSLYPEPGPADVAAVYAPGPERSGERPGPGA